MKKNLIDEYIYWGILLKYSNVDISKVLFIDEVHVDSRNSNRKYGYGLIGNTVHVKSVFVRKERTSFVCSVSIEGIMHYIPYKDSVSQYQFDLFMIEQVLTSINDDWLIIMDNASIHKGIWKEIFEHMGINYVFLPPYSPQLNPIEIVFGWFKKKLLGKYDLTRICPVQSSLLCFDELRNVDISKIFYEIGYYNVFKIL